MDIKYLKNNIKENEIAQKKDKKQTYLSARLLQVVEKFMNEKKRICYGGTAINSILPKEKQFYNYDIDIPDYDFFSPTALDDAKELCDLFKKENIFHVEGKNAISFGTYKVFVNFVPIADITQIDESFYHYLLNYAVEVNDILYTPPSYLRMSLHQELARPKGDITRWEKIYERMQLLNKYFPVITKPLSKTENMYIKIKTKDFQNIYQKLFNIFIKENVIFCNLHIVSCVYKKYIKKNQLCSSNKNDFFIIYTEQLSHTIKQIRNLNISTISLKKKESKYKFIDNYCFIYYKQIPIGILFQTNSCLSYIETKFNKQLIYIGNIDTLLNLYFSIMLMDLKEINYNILLELISKLNKIVNNFQDYLNSGKPISKELERFKLPCLGDQEDFPKLLRTKQKKFNELKNNKRSIEYKKWFFKYIPKLKNITKKKKKKNQRKTKKI
tara:strand:+ start:3454 stop:4776 length:1323 start_codon:yes stop_codon:yes gene_type:complete